MPQLLPVDASAGMPPSAILSSPVSGSISTQVGGSYVVVKGVTNDPMEAHYIGFNMWINAVEKAGTTDTDAVRQAIYGQTFANLTGGTATMLPNHHLSKPVLIGEINEAGQFDVVKQTTEVNGDAWTDFLPASKKLKSDWKNLGCGKYDTTSNTCVQIKSDY